MEYIEVATRLLDLYKFPEEMSQYNHIYIYGAGMVGRYIYEYLKNHYLGNKICCFFSSRYQEGGIFGLPIRIINKEEIDTNGIVLLAAKRGIRKEMISVCNEKEITNIREIDVLDDRDYDYYVGLAEEAYPIELELWYKNRTGKILDLLNPQTYNEKINWLKLYDNNPLKTVLTDKYAVREWVRSKIGEEYLVPLLGRWESFDEIDFNSLPNSFVLKCNHGCGYNAIIRDKKELDTEKLKERFEEYLSKNYAFEDGFQMQYKDIQPCIIAEEYMENREGDLYDYKFWCFDGKVKFVMFLSERQKHLKMNNYDLEWKLLPFTYSYDNTDYTVEKPSGLNEMIRLSEILSEGFDHVRVDLYGLNDGTIRFGEMTFSSCTGVADWKPVCMDTKMGKWLHVAGERREQYRIMIETSSICNAKCSFCPNPSLKRTKGIMTDETFNLIIKRIEDEGIDVERFILHLNGEPLTDKDIFDRVRTLKRRFPSAGVYFTTNFALAKKESIDDILLCGLDQITISVNSLDEDEYMGLMGLELERTLSNIDLLLKMKEKKHSKIKIRISVVARDHNAGMIERIKERFSHADDVRVICLGNWISDSVAKKHTDSIGKGVNPNCCEDLFHQICFLSNGDMALCCFDSEGIIKKNIYSDSILDGFNSEEYTVIREKQILRGRTGFCAECSFS